MSRQEITSRSSSPSRSAEGKPRSRGRVAEFVVGAAIALVLLLLIYSFYPSHGPAQEPVAVGPMRYFSIDDGQSWFPDDANKLPPFAKDGKQAARAYVFQCPDGSKFVAFLERLTPTAKKKFEAMAAAKVDLTAPDMIRPIDLEVKAPGQSIWLSQTDPRAAAFLVPKCPMGGAPRLLTP
jgi:hypothetical protein